MAYRLPSNCPRLSPRKAARFRRAFAEGLPKAQCVAYSGLDDMPWQLIANMWHGLMERDHPGFYS